MYLYTFKRSISCFAKQLFSPIILSLILVAVLYPIYLLTEDYNIFLSLTIKSIVVIIIFGLYIQLTHEYNILSKVKKLISKFNR